MSEPNELLPCPFCGSDTGETALKRWNPVMDRWRVVCGRGCHAEGPATDTEAEAIAAWNTRLTEQARPTAGEALAEALERLARAAGGERFTLPPGLPGGELLGALVNNLPAILAALRQPSTDRTEENSDGE